VNTRNSEYKVNIKGNNRIRRILCDIQEAELCGKVLNHNKKEH